MCIYYANYRKKRVTFLSKDIFKEKNSILIKNAKNIEDHEDQTIPPIIPLKRLAMSEQDKQKIRNLFKKQKREKIIGRAKKLNFAFIV
ncbi:hypothetical protein JXE04_02065 [Patescibacteria group bacterium]|nr:hypothetical protein [Patescibacteria group bacterium]